MCMLDFVGCETWRSGQTFWRDFLFYKHHPYVACSYTNCSELSFFRENSPIIIILAIDLGVFGVARLAELYAAYTAEKALLVPELVRGELHEVAILNLLPTSFTYFLRLFALDCTDDVCKTKDSH